MIQTLRRVVALPALILAALPGVALADPPAGFVEHVEQLRQRSGSPGIAIAIVEHGEPVLVRGWGVRETGKPAPVDADTLFQIGSSGKAFTVAALALLVDRGQLGWDDKVIDHMPWFRMYDPWVTNEMTVRDLLTHRSGLGLGQGDLLFVPRASLSREETVRRLRYMKPATSFRSAYAYDNILYTAAGQLIEEVTGKRWESFIVDELLRPAGMDRATATNESRLATANRAHPHARVSGVIRGDGPITALDEREVYISANAAPAGGLALSAEELARWLQIQLGHGALPEGGRLYSEAAAKEMWAPVTPMPLPAWPAPIDAARPSYNSYALGWTVEDYHGVRVIEHGGGVYGSITMVVLLPDQDVGFAIVVNSEESELRRGLMYELLDHYTGREPVDWYGRFDQFMNAMVAGGKAALEGAHGDAAPVGPSLSLDRYVGTYHDPWYGDVVVGRDGAGLTIDFTTTPDMAGRLEHYQYDSFVTRFSDTGIENAVVTFQLNDDGSVDRVKMRAESPIADFSYDYRDLDLRPVESE
ncbi:serine hydrolase [Stakelama tenebrarum]|uniref:Serine hydrolase n=1 Tax=Stakelama tenebrarum TaxID=2711215 RepID=A0A6G6Y9B1_9SPHN|nr:serine hydrolase [Sphingosinithalassobacter tenebrarum]QIG81524.1 serine hydrolase [Sphingosinithalassobacter tenebrarum]